MYTHFSRIVLVTAAVALYATSAQAFSTDCRYGDNVRFATVPIEWRAGGAGTEDVEGTAEWDAVAAAFASWEAVECSTLAFTRGADVAEPSTAYTDGYYILVYFEDDTAFWEQAGNPLYVATLFNPTDGPEPELLYSVIVLNDAAYTWSVSPDGERDTYDVQSIVTRMLGRAIGLAKPPEGTDSVMAQPHRDNDVSGRTLLSEDIAAVQYLYPDETCADTPPGPDRVCCYDPDPEDGVDPCEGCVGSIDCRGTTPDGDADADSDADADGDGDSDGDGDTDADADADGGGDGDGDGDGDGGGGDGCDCHVASDGPTPALPALILALVAVIATRPWRR
jgi:hypothetical protein